MTHPPTPAEPRVEQLNQSIDGRLSRYLADRRHIAGIDGHARAQRKIMDAHQPEGGKWGALCQGTHDTAQAWPCASVLQFDDPMNYLD